MDKKILKAPRKIFELKYSARTIICKKRKFKVQVADTFRKMTKGLMGYTSLPKNGGMLFMFGREGKHGIWMLGMKMSIDIIWLDSSCRIVHVWERAQPCSSFFGCKTVKPDTDALYVVELAAGTVAEAGMRIGDKFTL